VRLAKPFGQKQLAEAIERAFRSSQSEAMSPPR
jgi:FixJ family two-component response regulator